jgi:hypothetical protein
MKSNYSGDAGHLAHVTASPALTRNDNSDPPVQPAGASQELAPELIGRQYGELVQTVNQRRLANYLADPSTPKAQE